MAIPTYNLPWTESPFFERELAAADLSPEDKAFVKFYAEKGYAIIDPEIDDAVIEGAKTELADWHDAYFKKNQQIHTSPHRIQDAWQFSESVKKIVLAPAVLKKLELLYRRRPIPFQTLNFDRGTQQCTHSDMIHFSSIPERFMCGVWMALEDITEDNGPLHYYPGSQKLPFYEMADMGVKASDSIRMKNGYMDYNDYYEKFIQDVVDSLGLQKEQLLIKKGQALIWSANLLHGGDPITRPNTSRHSQVSHYYFEDCTYYTPLFTDMLLKKIYLRQIVDISTGQQVPNRYFGEEIKESLPARIKQKVAQALPTPIAKFLMSLRGK